MKISNLKKNNSLTLALSVALSFSRTVKRGTLAQGKAGLSLPDLPDGIYYISAGTSSNVFREKIVVAH
jgi:hypothetical protein